MKMRLYELATPDNILYCPFCWRIRLLLELRRLEFESVQVSYKGIAAVEGPNGEKFDTVPILCNEMLGINDSWKIADYLSKTYAARGKVFRNEAERAQSIFMEKVTDRFYEFSSRLAVLNNYNALAAEDKEYFRSTREKDLGCSLEDAAKQAMPAKLIDAFGSIAEFLKQEQFFGGDAPNYADIIILSDLQYCVQMGKLNILDQLPSIRDWVNLCAKGLPSIKRWL